MDRRARWIPPLLVITLLVALPTTGLTAPLPVRLAGATTPQNISQGPNPPEDDAVFPGFGRAADGTLHAVWADNRNGAFDIFYTTSTDEGKTWGTPQQVTSAGTSSPIRSSLVVQGGRPLLSWSEEGAPLNFTIYYAEIGGDPPIVVPNEYTYLANQPSMTAGVGGDLHLVVAGALPAVRRQDVLYSRYQGTGWMTTTVVFTHALNSKSFDPQIAASADGSRLHLVWNNRVGVRAGYALYMEGIVGTDQVTWTTPITVSGDVTTVWTPDVAVAPNGDVHVVWAEILAQDVQYVGYARYDAGSDQWDPATRVGGGPFKVNANNPYGTLPTVATWGDSSDQVCIAWNAFPKTASYAEDILLICSEDGGQTWPGPENISRSARQSFVSIRPQLAIAPARNIHVVWQELVEDGEAGGTDYQIYHSRRLPLSTYLPVIMRFE